MHRCTDIEDPFAITLDDPDLAEERYLNLGLDFPGRLIVVNWALRGEDIRLLDDAAAQGRKASQLEFATSMLLGMGKGEEGRGKGTNLPPFPLHRLRRLGAARWREGLSFRPQRLRRLHPQCPDGGHHTGERAHREHEHPVAGQQGDLPEREAGSVSQPSSRAEVS